MVAELAGPPDEGIQGQQKNVPKSKVRVPVLDGIRGFAALAVLLTHVTYAGGVMDVGDHKGWPVFNWLSVGLTVSLAPFFLLSGLLLYRPFVRATFTGGQRPALKPFFIRRLLRILPAYWTVTLAALLLINLETIDSLWDVLRPILLLQWFVDTQNAMIPGLEITWSVDAELTFYLLLPVAAWLINKYARRVSDPAQQLRRILWSLSPIVVLGLAWEVYVHLPFMGPYPVQMFWPPGFLGLMAIGMMFAALSAYHEATGREPAIYRLAAKWPLSWWVAAFGVYILNCVKPFSVAGDGDYPPLSQALMDQVLFLLFAVLLTVPLFAPDARSRFIEALLGNRPMRFLGRISFGIYLWHFPAMYFAFGMGNLFGTPPQPMFMVIGTIGFWQLIAEVLAITIILSTLSFYLIERPAARLGDRFLRSGVPTATL